MERCACTILNSMNIVAIPAKANKKARNDVVTNFTKTTYPRAQTSGVIVMWAKCLESTVTCIPAIFPSDT